MGTQLYRSEGPACGPNNSMIIGGCPTTHGLGTIQTSFNISQAAPFAELLVTMQIVGSNNQSIVCVAVLLEQTMETVNHAVSFLPLALACLSGAISLAATFMRASVGNGFLGAAATYGMPTEQISVHTPGAFDIIFYTQFMLMTGQLSVNYPSFYSTFTALFHWSFLEFRDTLLGNGPANATDILTFGGAGSVNQIQDTRAGSHRGGNSNNYPSTTATATVATIPGRSSSLQKRDFDQGWRDQQEDGFFLGQDLLPLIWTAQTAAGRGPRVTLASSRTTTTLFSHTPTPFAKRQMEIAAGPSPDTPSVPLPSPRTPSVSVSTSPVISPSPNISVHPSPSVPVSPSPSTHKSPISSKPIKTPGKPNPTVVSTRTSPIRTPATSTSPILIIPTIRDAFTNTSDSVVQYNVSRFGVEAYAAAIGAYPSTLFLGTLINAALAMVAVLLLSGVFLGIAWMMAKEKHQRGKTLQHALNFVTGNMLRLWSLLYTPLALTAMYQLTISGGIARTIGSAASLLIISVGATILFTWRILRASSEHLLFDDLGTLLKYGPLYNTLAQEGTLFFLVTLLTRFLWGLAVAMLPSYGVAQVAVVIVVELCYILIIGVKWPFSESTDNKFHVFLGIIRIVITGLSVGYIHEIEASPELRELLAYIQMALHLAVFIVIFALILWNAIQVGMFWRTRHSDTWKGPTKTYSFEDPTQETEQGWGLNGRPFLHSGGASHSRGVVMLNNSRISGDGEDEEEFMAGKNRRFTVMSYSSLGSSGTKRESMLGALHAQKRQQQLESSDDETLRYGSPAERYRQSRLMDHRRSAFNQSASSETGSIINEPPVERNIGYLGNAPLGNVVGVGSIKGRANSPSSDTTTVDQHHSSPRRSNLAATRGHLPQRDSYTNLQRLSHQQPPVDPRTRRMSDITRDGPYLYNPPKEEQENNQEGRAAAVARESTNQGPGLWAGVKASLAGVFRFGRRSNHSSPSSDGSKPKAFEVMRPPRRHYAPDPESPTLSDNIDETGSQIGGDTRQLNSIGLSKFFQESDRGYEKNSNLVVANPSAVISRTGSLVSTMSGALGGHPSIRLQRDRSSTTDSVKTLRNVRSKGAGVGLGIGPTAAVSAVPASPADNAGSIKNNSLGVDTASSEHGGAAGSISASDRESRRASSALISGAGSITGCQLYPPRHSVESSNNLAEAMAIEEPLQLDGGGILKVSKGPEKAVQYFHKGTGSYNRSVADPFRDQTRLSRSEGMSATTIASSSISTPSLLLPPIQTHQLGKGGLKTESQSVSSSPVTKSPTSTSGGPSGTTDISNSSNDNTSSGVQCLAGSDDSSPTESQPSPNTNVAVSAGRMHEILGRMFSDRSIRLATSSDHDSDSVLSEDAHSSLSGPVSSTTGRRSLLGQSETTASTGHSDDIVSVEQYDYLQPVMEGSDPEDEDDYGSSSVTENGIDQDVTPRQSNFALVSPSATIIPNTAGSESGQRVDTLGKDTSPVLAERPPLLATTSVGGTTTTISQSYSDSRSTSPSVLSKQQQQQPGKLRPKQRSIGGRPLAQSPLHEPSVYLIRTASGSGHGHGVENVSSSPYLSSTGLPASSSAGVSRQSSIQSTRSTNSKLEYLDSNWMYNHNNGEQQLNRNASIGTVRTEASYVTAHSRYPSDDEEGL
ncbi:hypothetical protein FBU30_002341 [Linnemannia zychae]|nr:hypothetical protein FBU30_002341 [Linnemannia zychae]